MKYVAKIYSIKGHGIARHMVSLSDTEIKTILYVLGRNLRNSLADGSKGYNAAKLMLHELGKIKINEGQDEVPISIRNPQKPRKLPN